MVNKKDEKLTKNNDLKRPNHEKDDPAYDNPTTPDTSAPMGYIKDRPQRDKLSEEEIHKKAKGGSPSNDVELALHPNGENVPEDPEE